MQFPKAEVKDRITKAAIDEFYMKGYPLASLRNITERAQISTSNFYNNFKDKGNEISSSISLVETAMIIACSSYFSSVLMVRQ